MNLPRKGAKFCSQKCGTYFRRERRLPPELTSKNRWVRRSSAKVPLTTLGRYASSTDPRTWASHADANASDIGAGLGFVLNGDGIACVDLDGVLVDGRLDPRAETFLDTLDPFYVEVSPSGGGIHAWVWGASPSGKKVYSLDDGLKVEWYSDERYMTVTGKEYK